MILFCHELKYSVWIADKITDVGCGSEVWNLDHKPYTKFSETPWKKQLVRKPTRSCMCLCEWRVCRCVQNMEEVLEICTKYLFSCYDPKIHNVKNDTKESFKVEMFVTTHIVHWGGLQLLHPDVFLSLDFPKIKWRVKASWWPLFSLKLIFSSCGLWLFVTTNSPACCQSQTWVHRRTSGTKTPDIRGQAWGWSPSTGSKVKCQPVIKDTWQEQRLLIGCRITGQWCLWCH